MSYKPEKIPRHCWLCPKAAARARRAAKKAATRAMRRATARDPENAPVTRITRGWID